MSQSASPKLTSRVYRDDGAREIQRFKPKRKSKRPRQNDWWDNSEAWDGTSRREQIMAKGERSRRLKTQAESQTALEAVDEDAVDAAWEDAQDAAAVGTVLEVSSSLYRVAVDGRVLLCSLRGALSARETGYTNLAAVGDRVSVSSAGDYQGVIEAVLPRRSALARPDPFSRHLKQVIVANADQLLVVASWLDPPLWTELVDRYLIGAERNRLAFMLCLNKVDLATDRAAVDEAVRPYRELGYPVFLVSALTGEGIADLRERLRGQTTVLSGLSGVGKSSLLTAIQPDLALRTGAVSQHWGGQGQHTTTQVTLLALDEGGYVVDTPGIRDFAVVGLKPAELMRFYPDIAEVAARCRFVDCTHTHEPGCAVKHALQTGQIAIARYHNYRLILAELESS